MDTVKANKKFFRQLPDFVEFAKPFIQVSNWKNDIKEQAIQKQFEQISSVEVKPAQKLEKKEDGPIKVNHFAKPTKQYYGIDNRFPEGKAWYYSNHTAGQLGFATQTEMPTSFYSTAACTDLDKKVKRQGIRTNMKRVEPKANLQKE